MPRLSKSELSSLDSSFAPLLGKRHQNVLQVHAVWISHISKTLILITEIPPKQTVGEYTRLNGGGDLKTLRKWGLEVLSGLDFLHKHLVILGDLTLGHLLLDNGSVKIGNYFMSKVVQLLKIKERGLSRSTAPEVFDDVYSQKADVYSFGMCLLEAATGCPPY